MANTINVTYKVNEDGSLERISKGAEKAAKSTDKLGSSSERYNKKEKGVAGATSNSTKAFSKMTTGIGSGLVPAYATLAANVFAVTAAFGVLQRAARVQQLEEGLTAMGTAAGVAMNTMATGLVKATGHALTLEEAMRSTALITSSGFGADTIERLGEVARKASIALGRDTADSLARLTRGAAKLEPELLDELGIMVRLDEATETYGRSIGKTASELTSFERRQAFMNAVLEEGERKFSSMGEVDVNPYDRLSASFANMSKNLLNLINDFGGLFIIDVLSKSTLALGGVLLIFSKSIITAALPALAGLGESLARSSKRSAQASIEKLKLSKAFTGGTKSAQDFVSALQSGENVEKAYAKALRFTNQSIVSRAKHLQAAKDAEVVDHTAIKAKTQGLKEQKAVLHSINVAYLKHHQAQISSSNASIISLASQGKLSMAYKRMLVQFRRYNKATEEATKNSSGLNSFLLNTSNRLKKAALGARVFGAALVNMIPIIGQIIFVVGFLWEGLKALRDAFKTEAQKKYEEQSQELIDTTKELVNTFSKLNKETNTAQRYIAFSTAFETMKKNITEVNEAAMAMGPSSRNWFGGVLGVDHAPAVESMQQLIESSPEVSAAFAELYGEGKTLINVIGRGADQSSNLAQVMLGLDEKVGKPAKAMNLFAKSVKGASEPLSKFMAAFRTSTPIDGIVAAFDDLAKTAIKIEPKTAQDFMAILEKTGSSDLLKVVGFEEVNDLVEKGKLSAEQAKAAITGIINNRTTELKRAQESYQIAKRNEEAAKSALSLAKGQVLHSRQHLDIINATNKGIDARIDQLEAERTTNEILLSADKDSVAYKAEEAKINAEINNLLQQRVDKTETVVAQAKENLSILQRRQQYDSTALDAQGKMNKYMSDQIAARKTIMEIDQKIQNRKDPTRGGNSELTALDEYNIAKTLQTARETAAEAEADLKLKMIDQEYALLEAKLLVLKAEADNINAKKPGSIDTTALSGVINNLSSMRATAISTVGLQLEADLRSIVQDIGEKSVAAIKEGITASGSTADRATKAGQSGVFDKDGDATNSEKLAGVANILSPQIEMLKSLSPEGELISAAMEGALALSDTFVTAFEKMEAGGSKVQAGLSIAGAAVSALSAIQQAQSNAAVSEIDKQIDAEKKRDGKSKASQEKLLALEKKKDAIKKKAFEQNKKMQMAQVVINTASAIMAVMDDVPAPFNFVLAGLVGAMGAMQLSAIASSSYQGGGSAASVGAPSKAAVGSRQNSVDTAKARSPSGELAYARGQQGTGSGMTNFTPAFTGAKYRAAGGNTAFMVGEQGPEMFIPDRPGRITPADDTEAMGQTPVNVSFNISAIDSTNLEEMLMTQRGNLIGMIREAANSHGETFLESVSTREI